MSQNFVNGAKYSFSTILGANEAIEEISNALDAVVTLAAGGTLPAEDAIVILKSNWSDLNEGCAYVGSPSGTTFVLEGTTDETFFFPDESAPSSFQVVSGMISLSQIREIAQTGGDTNTFNWGYVDDRGMRQRSKPTDQNPVILTFTMDNDFDLPWYKALETVSKKRQLVVMRERLITGDVLLYSGYMSFQKSPSRTRNENQTVTATMTINSEIMRYPAAFFAGS